MRPPIHLPHFEPMQKPERIFARSGTAKSTDVRADGNGVTIGLYDQIGEPGISTGQFKEALRAAAGRPLTLEVDSPGGSVFTAISIYNLLLEYQGPIAARVIGVAASAASMIIMAAQRIEIASTAFVMIHEAMALAWGNKSELAGVIDLLAEVDEALISMYAAKTGLEDAEIAALMEAETWLRGQAAVDAGFADSVIESDAGPAASFDLSTFRNVPSDLAHAPRARTELRSAADVKRILRAAGVPDRAAATIAAKGFAAFTGEPDPDELAYRQLADRVAAATAKLGELP
jgi:ATP-dependent Clp protease protease subunit